MAMLFSPRAARSIEARSDRPISRLISWVRPPIRPLTDSRSLRVWVARGSIEYSAVTQPRPEPLRQRGTPSVTLAAQSTRVRPNSTSTEPSAWSSQWRVMVTGRSWSGVRPSGRVTDAEGSDCVSMPRMRSELRAVRTGGMPAVVDLTDECAEFVRSEGDGLLHVFVPHATAGLAIIETGSGSDDDLLAQLDELLPRDDRWRHAHGHAGPRPRPRRPGVRAAATPACPCWRGGCSWAPGSGSAWSTPTPTTTQRHVRFSFLAG